MAESDRIVDDEQFRHNPNNLMDFHVDDVVHGTPPLIPRTQNVETLINTNFDKFWREIENFGKQMREEMRSQLDRALEKVDHDIAVLKANIDIAKSCNSSPNAKSGAGDRTIPLNSETPFRTPRLNLSEPSRLCCTLNDRVEVPTRVNDDTTADKVAISNQTDNDCRNQARAPKSKSLSNVDNLSKTNSNPSGSSISSGTQNGAKMKPQFYDGSEDLEDYLSQFEILAELNQWNYHSKSLYLASSLKGDARSMLSELSPIERRDFDTLVDILKLRFGSVNRSEIYKANLQTRTKHRDESISELAQSIKKLTRQAYPNAPYDVVSTLARDHFIDALPESDMRLRLREAQAQNIEQAEILALRLEAYRVADRQKSSRKSHYVHQVDVGNDKQSNDTDVIKNIVDGFRQEFKTLSNDIKQVVKSQNQQPARDNRLKSTSNQNNIRQDYHYDNRRQEYSNPNQGRYYGNNDQNYRRNGGVPQGNPHMSHTRANVRQANPRPQ